MKTTFDINRFYNLMRYEVLSESKNFLRGLLGLTMGLTFYFCLIFYAVKDSPSPEKFHNIYLQCENTAYFAFFCVMFVAGCMIFKNMLTKQQRIAFMALPASNLEKFIARFLWTNVGYLLMVILSTIFADILLALFSLCLGEGVHGSVVFAICERLFDGHGCMRISGNRLPDFYFYLWMTTVVFFLQSSWTFIGTLFRKNAWLWAICLEVLFGSVFVVLLDSEPFWFTSFYSSLYDAIGVRWMVLSHSVLGLAASALLYWGSYKLFVRMQVINNKWVNI